MSAIHEAKTLLAKKNRGEVTAHYILIISAVIMAILFALNTDIQKLDSSEILTFLILSFLVVWGIIGILIFNHEPRKPYRYAQDTDPLRNIWWTSY